MASAADGQRIRLLGNCFCLAFACYCFLSGSATTIWALCGESVGFVFSKNSRQK